MLYLNFSLNCQQNFKKRSLYYELVPFYERFVLMKSLEIKVSEKEQLF